LKRAAQLSRKSRTPASCLSFFKKALQKGIIWMAGQLFFLCLHFSSRRPDFLFKQWGGGTAAFSSPPALKIFPLEDCLVAQRIQAESFCTGVSAIVFPCRVCIKRNWPLFPFFSFFFPCLALAPSPSLCACQRRFCPIVTAIMYGASHSATTPKFFSPKKSQANALIF